MVPALCFPALLRKHNACSCGEGWNCYAKFSPGENFATFLNGEIFPAEFSPDEIFPAPVTHKCLMRPQK